MLQEIKDQVISYADFIHKALYAPGAGYYTSSRKSVGYAQDTDFYTAQSLNTNLFNKLTLEACTTLLNADNLSEYSFVEIGSQPTNPLIHDKTQFANHVIVTPGDPIEIQQKSIVFANELLDAQPFHRLIYSNGAWHELGVRIHSDDSLSEEKLPTLSSEVTHAIAALPAKHHEGYHLDLPLASENISQPYCFTVLGRPTTVI